MPIDFDYREGWIYQEGKQQGLIDARKEMAANTIDEIAMRLHGMGLDL